MEKLQQLKKNDIDAAADFLFSNEWAVLASLWLRAIQFSSTALNVRDDISLFFFLGHFVKYLIEHLSV